MTNTSDFEDRVRRYMQASLAVKKDLMENREVVSVIIKVGELFINAFREGNKAILFGNGGSAADAQHIAADFVGRFGFDRPALPALALHANSSSVTAIANDYGFDSVFSRQIEAFGRSRDVAFGISTSGKSANVLTAILTARKMGLHTIGLTGSMGKPLKQLVDHCICVPSAETPRIQECHVLIGHVIAELVEQTMFAGKTGV
jgi:D-sedoheptulose 7-phosphate isomerase